MKVAWRLLKHILQDYVHLKKKINQKWIFIIYFNFVWIITLTTIIHFNQIPICINSSIKHYKLRIHRINLKIIITRNSSRTHQTTINNNFSLKEITINRFIKSKVINSTILITRKYFSPIKSHPLDLALLWFLRKLNKY